MIVLKSPAETISTVYKLGGYFETEKNTLWVKGLDNLPDNLRQSIQAHKTDIRKYVSAFNGRWPPISKEGL